MLKHILESLLVIIVICPSRLLFFILNLWPCFRLVSIIVLVNYPTRTSTSHTSSVFSIHFVVVEVKIVLQEHNVTGCFKWPFPWAYIGGGKLLETLGAIYTKPLVRRVWKVLEMPRDDHTSLHYGGRHGRSPRLSRDF